MSNLKNKMMLLCIIKNIWYVKTITINHRLTYVLIGHILPLSFGSAESTPYLYLCIIFIQQNVTDPSLLREPLV